MVSCSHTIPIDFALLQMCLGEILRPPVWFGISNNNKFDGELIRLSNMNPHLFRLLALIKQATLHIIGTLVQFELFTHIIEQSVSTSKKLFPCSPLFYFHSPLHLSWNIRWCLKSINSFTKSGRINLLMITLHKLPALPLLYFHFNLYHLYDMYFIILLNFLNLSNEITILSE